MLRPRRLWQKTWPESRITTTCFRQYCETLMFVLGSEEERRSIMRQNKHSESVTLAFYVKLLEVVNAYKSRRAFDKYVAWCVCVYAPWSLLVVCSQLAA